MKPILASCLFVACCGVLFAGPPPETSAPGKPAPLLEQLVQMTAAGSSDVDVLAYAQAHRRELPPRISGEDLRWLRDSGVSQRVVDYMSAVDVRPSGNGAQENVSPGPQEKGVRPRAPQAYSEGEDEAYGNQSADEYAEGYPDEYPDRSYDAYSGGYGYPGCGYGYYPDCGYGYYPFYGYSYPYPFFFSDGGRFFGRFHHRGHRFHRPRHFDGRGFRGPRGSAVGRFASRDAWRERGFQSGRRGPVVVGPRGSARPRLARRGFGGGMSRPYPRAVGPRGFAPRSASPRAFSRGSGATGGTLGGRGGFHGGFSRPVSGGGARLRGGFSGGRGRR